MQSEFLNNLAYEVKSQLEIEERKLYMVSFMSNGFFIDSFWVEIVRNEVHVQTRSLHFNVRKIDLNNPEIDVVEEICEAIKDPNNKNSIFFARMFSKIQDEFAKIPYGSNQPI